MTREQYDPQYGWHEFQAWNQQNSHGYGTQSEADEYLEILNAGRTVGLYWSDRLDDYYAANVLRLEENTEAFNLDDELAARKGLR